MKMLDWLRDIGRLPESHTLREEMLSLTYYNAPNGKIKTISKKELEKSTDEVYAISYSFVEYMN